MFGVVFQFTGGFFGDVIGQNPKRASGLQGADIGFGRPFKIVEPIEGFGDGIADDHDAMIAHNHHLFARISEERGAAFAFFLERQAAVVIINHVAIEKRRTVLINRGEGAIGERGENGGVD